MKGELVNRYEGWKMGEEAGGSTQRETHIGASIYRIGGESDIWSTKIFKI